MRLSSEVRWVTTKTYAYRGADGAVTRVAGYVVDHYERKRAEAESIKQQQQITHLTRVAMLGELSGALAHELQQPLTAILCNAQAAQLPDPRKRGSSTQRSCAKYFGTSSATISTPGRSFSICARC